MEHPYWNEEQAHLTETIGVVGLFYSMVNLLTAVSSVLLGGTSVLCGRYMGRGEMQKTRGVFSLNLTVALFAGALITETLFSLRGIGYASYTSMTTGDIPFIMFYLAFISILTLLGNLISDLLYAVVDPRVRLS